MKAYISASQELGKAFVQRGIQGPIVMLNLLRFKDAADYQDSPELASAAPISGRAAYDRYIQSVLPLLEAAGATILFQGEATQFLIGPEAEKWDAVILVRHQSTQVFLQFAQDEDYQKIAGHRTAALADSRLLPIEEKDFS